MFSKRMLILIRSFTVTKLQDTKYGIDRLISEKQLLLQHVCNTDNIASNLVQDEP